MLVRELFYTVQHAYIYGYISLNVLFIALSGVLFSHGCYISLCTGLTFDTAPAAPLFHRETDSRHTTRYTITADNTNHKYKEDYPVTAEITSSVKSVVCDFFPPRNAHHHSTPPQHKSTHHQIKGRPKVIYNSLKP